MGARRLLRRPEVEDAARPDGARAVAGRRAGGGADVGRRVGRRLPGLVGDGAGRGRRRERLPRHRDALPRDGDRRDGDRRAGLGGRGRDPVHGRRRVGRAAERAPGRRHPARARRRRGRVAGAGRTRAAAAPTGSGWRCWRRSASGSTSSSRTGRPTRASRTPSRPRAESSLLLALVAALVVGASLRPGRRALPVLALVGLCDVGANMLFSLATTRGYLSIVSVLAALYPVVDGRARGDRPARAGLADAATRRRGRPRRRGADHRRLSVGRRTRDCPWSARVDSDRSPVCARVPEGGTIALRPPGGTVRWGSAALRGSAAARACSARGGADRGPATRAGRARGSSSSSGAPTRSAGDRISATIRPAATALPRQLRRRDARRAVFLEVTRALSTST